MTGLRPFAIIKAPASGAVNAEATSLSRRPTRPQANEDVGRIIRRGLRGFRPGDRKICILAGRFLHKNRYLVNMYV